jgi:putative hydrolase of the HAD superfamily
MILGDHIRAVTFDVGGTLIEPFPSVGHVYSEVAAQHGVRVSPEVLNERFAAAWKAKKNFGHSMQDWSDLVDETFAELSSVPPSRTFFPQLYRAFSEAGAWHVFDDVFLCLERLRERGFRLAVISNWDERLVPLLEAIGLAKFFDATAVSIEVGEPKPGRRIFDFAQRELGIGAAHILHVGDAPVEDVNGARAAGFEALLLKRDGPESCGQISNLLRLFEN